MSLNKQSFSNLKEQNKHKHKASNERLKYKYRIKPKRGDKHDEKTIKAIFESIRDFELITDFADLKTFNDEIADKYINKLQEYDLSLSYLDRNLRYLKAFLHWLDNKGLVKLDFDHIEYLTMSRNERSTAKAPLYQKSYTINQIIKAINLMPEKTLIDIRNKAMVSLQALCGLRVSELKAIKIRNLIKDEYRKTYFIDINPKDVGVKNAKKREAYFMPFFPKRLIENVLKWRDYLLSKGFKKTDPLFPKIPNHFNQLNLLETNLSFESIKSSSAMKSIFETAFKRAEYEYIKIHNFRHTIARFAYYKKDFKFFHRVSLSLGHKGIETTLNSYVGVQDYGEGLSSDDEDDFAIW